MTRTCEKKPSTHMNSKICDDRSQRVSFFHLLLFSLCLINNVNSRKIAVIGSGPGGTGFLRRALQICQDDDSFMWFEEGSDEFVILNWPEDYTRNDAGNFQIAQERENLPTKAIRFRMFGGGAAGNSGGPISIYSYGPFNETVDKYAEELLAFEVRSEPATDPSSERWIQQYLEVPGFIQEKPFFIDHRNVSRDGLRVVGYAATTFAPDSSSRSSLAREVAKDPRITLRLNTKVERVVLDTNNKATGVELIDGTQEDFDDIVIACGVFGTFELLVHSGIGSERDLQAAGVVPRIINENVGRVIGEDSGFIKLIDASNETNAASHSADFLVDFEQKYLIEAWPPGAWDVLSLFLGAWTIPTPIDWLLRLIFSTVAYTKFAFPSNYAMRLHMGSNGKAVLNDGSEYVEAGTLCVGDEISQFVEDNFPTSVWTWLFSLLLDLLGFTKYDSATGCNTNGYRVGSFHYHGGSGPQVVDENFAVRGATALYVSDASITTAYRVGAPMTNVMLLGFKVADVFPW